MHSLFDNTQARYLPGVTRAPVRRLISGLLIVLLPLFATFAGAQVKFEQKVERDADGLIPDGFGELQVAPVVVNGELLFYVVGVSAFPAERRAARVVRRIEAVAEDARVNPKSLRIVETDLSHQIFAAHHRNPLVSIFDEDADLEGFDREVIVHAFQDRIARVISAYREDRKPDVIFNNLVQALIRTVALAAILVGLFWGFRKLAALLDKHFHSRLGELETKSAKVIQAEQVLTVLHIALRILRAVCVLVVVYVFLHFVLSLFPWTRYVAHRILEYILDPLGDMLHAAIGYIPSLIFLTLLFFIIRYVLKLMRGFFAALGRERVQISGFDPDWALPTYRIVRVVVIVFAIVIAYPYIPGSDSEAFRGISILLGVLFSLGSSSMISNIVAGYTMTYRRAFRIGDRVKIGENLGDVTEMRLLVTHLRSLKNEEVVIPNSAILNNEVTNFSTMAKEQGLILHTTVGIGYEVPWRQVEAMLLQAADRTEGLLKEPEPFVLQSALADYAVNYELNVYCSDEKQSMTLYTELHRNIQDVFNEYEIQIMTPSYIADTPEPKIVPKDKWYTEPALSEPSKS